MRLLLDTRLRRWTVIQPDRITTAARRMIEDSANVLHCRIASLWEVAIKRSLGRAEFTIDCHVLHRPRLDSRYGEVAVDGTHAVAVDALPLLHKDPFDRLLIAQAMVEGIVLSTSDASLGRHPGPIRKVQQAAEEVLAVCGLWRSVGGERRRGRRAAWRRGTAACFRPSTARRGCRPGIRCG